MHVLEILTGTLLESGRFLVVFFVFAGPVRILDFTLLYEPLDLSLDLRERELKRGT